MSKSIGERQETFQAGQRELGRIGRLKWCTPTEHDQCDAFLRKLRGEIECLDWDEVEDYSDVYQSIGNKGQYFIAEGAWCYLTLRTGDYAGPREITLGGNFDSVEEAKAFAEAHDSKL